MGPKLTNPLAIFVGAVAVFGSVRPAPAQNFPRAVPDYLAVRMPDDATGVDVKAVVAIAIRLGVPLGFEEVGALADEIKGPFRPLARRTPVVGRRPTPLDVRGVPLRQALDGVMVKDRRYAWRMLDGVVVIRPVAAWGNAGHPLLQPDGSSDGTLLDRLNAAVRARPRSHWILSSDRSLILLDRGQAVEILEPLVRLTDEQGEERIRLGWR